MYAFVSNMAKSVDEVSCSKEYAMDVSNYENPVGSADRAVLAAFFCIMIIASAIGNIWTLLTISKRPYQTFYKCCLISLTIGDLFTAIFITLDQLAQLINPKTDWVLGDGMCHLIPFISTACVLSSTFVLTCVAADRYQGIAWLHKRFSPNIFKSVATLLTIWLVSLGASSPMWIFFVSFDVCVFNITSGVIACQECITVCSARSLNYRDYFVSILSAIFLPLFIIFLLSYGMVAWRVWGARRKIARSPSEHSPVTCSTDMTATPQPRPPPATASHANKKLRTFRVVLWILTSFIICRLPQWLFNTYLLYEPLVGASHIVAYSLSILTLFNTAINPLLYHFLDSVLSCRCPFSICSDRS